jgi:hypothetical protein
VVIRARDWECRGTTSCDHECKGTQESDRVMISTFEYGQYIVERGTSSKGVRSLDKRAEFVEPTPWLLPGYCWKLEGFAALPTTTANSAGICVLLTPSLAEGEATFQRR